MPSLYAVTLCSLAFTLLARMASASFEGVDLPDVRYADTGKSELLLRFVVLCCAALRCVAFLLFLEGYALL
jgi:hypothetical protein